VLELMSARGNADGEGLSEATEHSRRVRPIGNGFGLMCVIAALHRKRLNDFTVKSMIIAFVHRYKK
jgi:hypothetical protein